MRKKTLLTFLIVCLAYVVLSFSGCANREDDGTDRSTQGETEAQKGEGGEENTGNDENGKENAGNGEDGEEKTQNDEDNVLTWSINLEEDRMPQTEKANQYLKRLGKDYKICFQSDIYFGGGIEKRYRMMAKACENADIISLPDNRAYSESTRLIQKGLLMDLTDLVEDGSLGKGFAPIQWDSVRVDGKIYNIPSTGRDYKGIYFAFRRKYFSKKDLKGFDGTLDGVDRLIRKKGSGASLQKSIYYEAAKKSQVEFGICDLRELASGYCQGGLYYPDDGEDVDLWFKMKEVRACYRMLNQWYRAGMMMTDLDREYGWLKEQNHMKKIVRQYKRDVEKVGRGDYMVFIGKGDLSDKIKDPEDVLVFRPKARIVANPGPSVAISAATEKKEMAVDFLNLLYSDRKLADMLTYGEEGDSYTIKDGKVRAVNDSEDQRMKDTIEYLNTYGSCTELGTLSGDIPVQKKARKNYKGISYYLAGPGKLLDLHQDVKQYTELWNLSEKKYSNLYKVKDFDKTYEELLSRLEDGGYTELCEHANAQIRKR